MSKKEILVPLEFPIDCGENKSINEITIRRPKSKHVIKLTKIFGQSIINFVFDDSDGKSLTDKAAQLKEGVGDFSKIAELLSDDKIDALFALIADLAKLSVEEAEEIDLADLPAIGKGFIGFFPSLAKLTDKISSPPPPPPALPLGK